ncbi:hypothetical protein PS726_00151 [Pseudomonas fluorescens]|nr:hypothetical protein PS726_00151 [Pseudomonas fluorescens]
MPAGRSFLSTQLATYSVAEPSTRTVARSQPDATKEQVRCERISRLSALPGIGNESL